MEEQGTASTSLGVSASQVVQGAAQGRAHRLGRLRRAPVPFLGPTVTHFSFQRSSDGAAGRGILRKPACNFEANPEEQAGLSGCPARCRARADRQERQAAEKAINSCLLVGQCHVRALTCGTASTPFRLVGQCHVRALTCGTASEPHFDGWQASLSPQKNTRVPSAAARVEFDDQVICLNHCHASHGTARLDCGFDPESPGLVVLAGSASEADAEQEQTGKGGNRLHSDSSILHAYPVSPTAVLAQPCCVCLSYHAVLSSACKGERAVARSWRQWKTVTSGACLARTQPFGPPRTGRRRAKGIKRARA